MAYPGNKSRILKKLLLFVPEEFNTYYEPFLGSGAMYLALEPKKAVLNDLNKDLVNTWRNVKKDPGKFIQILDTLKNQTNTPSYLKKLISMLNVEKNVFARGALYFYILKISYMAILLTKDDMYSSNGVNKNRMNISSNLILQASKLLKTAKIYSRDYKQILKTAKKGDFVYLDPPYIHNLKNPVVYKTRGEEKILEELKNQMDSLTSKGVYVMLSNSDYPIVKDTFKDYFIHELRVYRPHTKKYAIELVITNYQV